MNDFHKNSSSTIYWDGIRLKKWTDEEVNRLIRNYSARPGDQISARIDGIVDSFPGRTKKAIAIKLREKHSEIYYRTKNFIKNYTTKDMFNIATKV